MAALRRSLAAAATTIRSLTTSHNPRRALASAVAAVVEDYWTDDDDDNDELNRRGASVPVTGEWGSWVPRGVQWVFMGGPTAHKRVYATRVADLLAVPYISMGTLVRQELNPLSTLYKKIANAVNEGRMVPEDIIFGLLAKRLEEGYQRGETGFILDGIPRTITQAEILDQIAEIDMVVNFKCMEDCLVKKHFGADICSHCGKAFDASASDSTNLNPCLATRSRHAQLIADATIRMKDIRIKKQSTLSEQSKLLEEYYRKQGKLLNFQASGGPGETWHGLLAALDLQHIDTNPSKKLTV